MILFLHIEKTAGTSLAYYLKSKFGIKFIDLYPLENGNYITNNDIKNAIKFNNPVIVSSHKIFLDKIDLSIFSKVIIILRDPYKRFISHYNHLKELKRVNCITLEEAILNPHFINLQYKKLGGSNANQILKSLNAQKKLILLKTKTFNEDFLTITGIKNKTPKKNIRSKKLISRFQIKKQEHNFKKINRKEYNIINSIDGFYNIENYKNVLMFNTLKSFNIKVVYANIYRKYIRLPILILKRLILKQKLLNLKNMTGYYICTTQK